MITKIATHVMVKKELRLMGNHFEFTAICEEETTGVNAVNQGTQEVQRIESLLTTFRDDSETNLINAAAGIAPVVVSKEIFGLIQRSVRISSLTQGAFDITYGSIDKRLWNFDVKMDSLPDKKTARSMVRLINYNNIILNPEDTSVLLKEKGMRIGFGGIGKGYAADRAKAVMMEAGIANGIVNAAGDLTVWGTQADGSPWTVGIADPDKRSLPFASIQLTNSSVATSGTYEKFATINGKKYSHTIDPKTGYPVSGIKSVTIICGVAELADALATPVMVMGVKAGISLINQLKGVDCIIIDDQDNLYHSKNINLT
jgi:thiamine biosynthesis lipoprotein